jgi:phosphoribosylformylglycinamidine cyclo-ligase
MSNTTQSLTYADAGVSIDAGNQLVSKIKNMARKTHSPNVLSGIGGFASLFSLPGGLNEPVLVSSTDGVGTKLKLAIDCDHHTTIGQDLVAMCVNDLLVVGATPLFFLDYFACGKLKGNAEIIIQSIADGCQIGQLALVGGETAEMPGLYADGDYDLAGFCVGVVEKSKMVDGSTIKPGDLIIGLPSSGVHSNGYSLVRKVLEQHDISLQTAFEEQSLGQYLLTPTRIYTRAILSLVKAGLMKGAAHITGGGLIENIPRVLPANLKAVIQTSAWTRPRFFSWLQTTGPISEPEMWRTFNMGIGMTLVIDPSDATEVLALLKAEGESPMILGTIETHTKAESIVELV